MRRNYLCLFMAACLFMVACERSTETSFVPESETPKMAKSSKISISDAIKVAMEGISMLDDVKTRVQQRVVDPSKTETYVRPATRSGKADTLFYVINFADSAGFAIVAADPAASPQLLAVAESGSYSPNFWEDDKPDPWEGWIEETKGPIRDENGNIIGYPSPLPDPNDPDPLPDLPGHPITPDTVVTYSDWVTAGPYLEVKWGQIKPYNKYCEKVGAANLCVTGCTATALAQILSYYQYPEEMEVTFTKNPEYIENFSHPEVGDFITLNWDELKQHVVTLDNTPCSCSETNHTNLAILFRELGELLNMKYEENGSSADFGRITDVLRNLGYSSNDTVEYSWNVVRSELDSARVVAMSGVRVDEEGKDAGHVWVVDGYKTRTETTTIGEIVRSQIEHKYLHINWGGSGKGDGYYWADPFSAIQYEELDNKAEDATGNSNNYHRELSIITGIKSPIQNND